MSVQLIEPSPVVEGDNLTLCTTVTFLGDMTALECNISVYLDTTNRKAGGHVLNNIGIIQIIVVTFLILPLPFRAWFGL